jgi:hypothetical protein
MQESCKVVFLVDFGGDWLRGLWWSGSRAAVGAAGLLEGIKNESRLVFHCSTVKKGVPVPIN